MTTNRTLLLVLTALAFLAGCGGDLSRSRAAKLLEESAEFDTHRYIRFQDGMTLDYDVADDSELAQLVNRGLLRKEEVPVNRWTSRYKFHLTDEGRKESATWKRDKDDEDSATPTLLIPRRKVSLAAVTGVFLDEDNQAIVEFDWTMEPDKYVSTEKAKGKAVAVLRKYDDGWRVSDVGKLR